MPEPVRYTVAWEGPDDEAKVLAGCVELLSLLTPIRSRRVSIYLRERFALGDNDQEHRHG